MPNAKPVHDNLKSLSEPLRRAPMAVPVNSVGPEHGIYMYPTALDANDNS
jgi:hypothetical protein